jgi:hypothetical protein
MTSLRMPRMLAVHAIAIAALAAACRAAPPTLDELGERYVRVALQLAQHDPSLVEAWTGPESLKPGPRVPVAGLSTEVDTLAALIAERGAAVSSSEESSRLRYLSGQVRALRFSADRLLGRSTSIDDQLREEFGIAVTPFDRTATEHVIGELERALPGTGPLSDRLSALRTRTTVPRDRRQAVMEIAVKACREPIAPLIELPADERVTMMFRSNMGWDAYAHYDWNHHTALDISDEGALDIGRALRLACHEGYAGHHTQFLLINRVISTREWPELRLTPGFGPHLLLAEGSAEVGADLAFSPAQRAALYRDRLVPAAGIDTHDVELLVRVDDLLPRLLPVVTDVARQYLDTKITEEQAIDRLTHEAMIANAAGTLAFIERRRARALVYGEGRRVIDAQLPARTLAALRDLFPFRAALQ